MNVMIKEKIKFNYGVGNSLIIEAVKQIAEENLKDGIRYVQIEEIETLSGNLTLVVGFEAKDVNKNLYVLCSPGTLDFLQHENMADGLPLIHGWFCSAYVIIHYLVEDANNSGYDPNLAKENITKFAKILKQKIEELVKNNPSEIYV